MKEPVDHILRPSLPWRRHDDGAITECGYDATKVKVLTRSKFFDRLKNYGRQRTAMITCMTCSDTASRWGTWEDDPRKALNREIDWECGWRGKDREARLTDELVSIAALIEAHRGEFDATITEIRHAREQRDDWLRKKTDLATRKSSASKGRSL